MRTLIIAEAGVNHNGDIEIAKELIDVAESSGADFVKFQTFDAKRLATDKAMKASYQNEVNVPFESQQEMLNRLALNETMHLELLAHCEGLRVKFLSSGFDIESVKMLIRLGQNIFKIPSGEITNLPYLRYIGNLGKRTILSTGMSTIHEIEFAVKTLEESGTERSKITVLQCTTAYPAPMTDVNLRAMQSISSLLKVSVGYSDHTLGTEVPIAAVALGACVIEKHFTLDRDLPGPDHKASLEPGELKAMVDSIRNIEIALGDGNKRPMPSEIENRIIARKSLVALRAIKAGELLTNENMTTKRPGSGVSPLQWENFLGRTASRNYEIDELIDET